MLLCLVLDMDMGRAFLSQSVCVLCLCLVVKIRNKMNFRNCFCLKSNFFYFFNYIIGASYD